ncbi:AtpZ/AtpI family protein [Pseudopedobacter beijingensis]|uniref:AtpZ/AtpI family protein n=1 Tax=Pseudopedobacter beijingensis TaxID=1207056 RepID=A0ABW4IH61_9SPHI
MEPNEENKPKDKKKQLLDSANSYVKYSALAFQMIGIIGFFAFVGYKIDQSRGHQTLIVTALLSLVGVATSLYTVIKSLKS